MARGRHSSLSITLTEEEQKELEHWVRSSTQPAGLVRRARIILLLAQGLSLSEVAQYVARLRRELFPPQAFVHRTHAPGMTMEGDFGESWAHVAGRLHKAHFFVAALPASNAIFAKAYPVERMECLMDGLASAFTFFGGLPERVVLDNTALAVKEALRLCVQVASA